MYDIIRSSISSGSLTAIVSLLGIWLAYHLGLALYNISPLHPLYHFPGPKLAAATYLVEAYYDWILTGRYGHAIKEMHKRYGPLVRINPDEIHCNDPVFTDEIYASASRVRDKWQHHGNTRGTGTTVEAAMTTSHHELHRLRRSALARFFSRQQMLKLEGEVLEFAHLTVDKILKSTGKEPFDIKECFGCFTADIISQYSFGEPAGFLAQESWEPNFGMWSRPFFDKAYTMRHNPMARWLSKFMPFVIKSMGDGIKDTMEFASVVIPNKIQKALDHPEDGRIFAEVKQSQILPEHEKTMERLAGEGFALLLAGTETTAASLTVATYWLLAEPTIYARLMDDLNGIDLMTMKWTELEQRTYLWAFIHEVLRMQPGISQRSARIARTEDLVYRSRDGKQWVIPKGTPMSATSMIIHWNKELFPNPDDFNPERWLLDGQPNHKLAKYLMSFGKGGRICIGVHLAYCELYIMTALLAMKIIPRARLYETTIDDIKYHHDAVVPNAKKGFVSVRVKLD